MAIVYTYPLVEKSSDLVLSDLFLLSKMNEQGRPTKSIRLEDLKAYISSGGGGGACRHPRPRSRRRTAA